MMALGRTRWWFAASLVVAASYGCLALAEAFSGPYVVQDDARQHVFWMSRFLDPGLFPGDLIADYFQSVAPAGYTAFYRLLAGVGLQPQVVNKLLPLALGIVGTAYCFRLSMLLCPVPFAAWISTVLLNQKLWLTTALVSGTPRAFLVVTFLAFLYYLARKSVIPCLATIVLQGLLYPQLVFVMAGVLAVRCVAWGPWPPRLISDRQTRRLCLAGLVTACAVLAPYAVQTSAFGPVITEAEARQWPEFQPGGRTTFFHAHPWTFWITGQRSGMFPSALPVLMGVGLLLPFLLRLRSRLTLADAVDRERASLLTQTAWASLAMFAAAHAVLFHLFFPSRYTEHSLPVVLALASGIALVILLDAVCHWVGPRAGRLALSRQQLAAGLAIALGIAVLGYPALLWAGGASFPRTSYKVGREPALYAFLAAQPRDSFIASLSSEADYLPTFAQRPVLTAREYAIPLHLSYYRQIRTRVMDLIQAQYSPDFSTVSSFIDRYGVDFWLLDREAFRADYLDAHAWAKQFQPLTADASNRLKQGPAPALSMVMDRCAAFSGERVVLLDATCVVNAAGADS